MTTAERQHFLLSHYKRFGRLPAAQFDEQVLTEEELRLIMEEAFKLPPEEALAYLKKKGVKVTWSWQDMEAAMHDKVFTIAKVASADILQLVKDKLTNAIETGKPFAEFKKELIPQLESAGWSGKSPSRLANIYRTNLQSAYVKGRWEVIKEAAPLRPYVRINAILDGATSDICLNLNGKVFRIDDPALRTPLYHFGCRTLLDTLNQRQLTKEGLTVESGEYFSKEGKPDASFDRHPDAVWEPDLEKYDPEIRAELERALKK